jgi:selenocysteine-specific elongation factor
MHVVATAGHVDHGKSTLVRALTCMEPDRWAEERRRGMTIDLGYAWTQLPSGHEVAFVDVPGHERFIGNMLAGLGPAPAVLFVVAADEGWSRQSTEHLTAIDALGIQHGLLAVTRSDLADPSPAVSDALERLGRTSLGVVEAVTVSGRTGSGLPGLQEALGRLVGGLPPGVTDARVRLWVDRAFTIRGSGTVVTGTLGSGHLAVGDALELSASSRTRPSRPVTVRGLESLRRRTDRVDAVARVAVNLRGVAVDEVGRGDVLLTRGAWRTTTRVDVRLQLPAADLPGELVLHVGTAAVPVHVRPLGGATARLVAPTPLPLQAGDRAILRDPARQAIVSGVLVLDADPPHLVRRGAAARRGTALSDATGTPDIAEQISRRGSVRRADLEALGVIAEGVLVPSGVREVAGWLVSAVQWDRWQAALASAVDAHVVTSPLAPRMPLEAARRATGIPDPRLLGPVAADAGLEVTQGRVARPGTRRDLSATEAALAQLDAGWEQEPFVAPEQDQLRAMGLGDRELAAVVAEGHLLRIAGDVVLAPRAPALAMRVLAGLDQPFTVSQARQALRTTRRVAIPLLEHLDARGWTVRVDANLRRVAGR